MVKFEHSLFALPFAASAVVLVAGDARLEPVRLLLVALAVVAARTAAMAMNRVADRAFDARNPRTSRRELVTGAVSLPAAWALLAVSAAAFALAAFAISPLCGALALPVLGVLLGYSYAKRFTWAVHLWLGVAQALGPIGVAVALTWARLLPLGAAAAMAAAGLLAGRGAGWLAGSVLMAVVLGAEHLYAAPGGQLRKERIGAAFFSFNAFASVAFAACALADLALRTRAP